MLKSTKSIELFTFPSLSGRLSLDGTLSVTYHVHSAHRTWDGKMQGSLWKLIPSQISLETWGSAPGPCSVPSPWESTGGNLTNWLKMPGMGREGGGSCMLTQAANQIHWGVFMTPPALRLPFSSGNIVAFAVSFLWPLCPCTGLQHLLGGVWPPSH